LPVRFQIGDELRRRDDLAVILEDESVFACRDEHASAIDRP
jgi:hypothetical protein